MAITLLSTMRGSVRAGAVLAALVLCALLAPQGVESADFGGSPIISYGQRFRIYSVYQDAFCTTNCTQMDCGMSCGIPVANIAQATYFVMGGSCGRAVSSNLTMASLYEFNGGSCATGPVTIENLFSFRCNKPQCDPATERFNILNVDAAADGWLRGNDSAIYIREQKGNPENDWCAGQSAPLGMWCSYAFSTIYTFKFVVD